MSDRKLLVLCVVLGVFVFVSCEEVAKKNVGGEDFDQVFGRAMEEGTGNI